MKLHALTQYSAILALGTSLAACSGMSPTPGAKADLQAKSGSMVSGQVMFTETSAGLRVQANVSGLTPGEHGFHVHEVGDCSAADGTSAKGHYNPTAKSHGNHAGMEHHVGDLPNLVADSQGMARYDHTVAGLSLKGDHGIAGRGLIIHADPDDYKSQPAGNSGKRVACGVIS